MRETIDLLYNVTGQSLYFDAPEGRPSSVTLSEVHEAIDGDDDDTESALTGSAAVETSPNTTFDAASGYGQSDPRVANVAATTGFARGRRYLATNATGEKEWIEVVEIASGASVTARDPLQNAYASADTLQSTRITHALDSTWIADEDNISDRDTPAPRYRWALTYVVGGVTYRHAIFFDIVRYKGEHTVTGLDVDRAYAGRWLHALGTYHREDQGAAVLDDSYRAVKMHLHQHGHGDQAARDPSVIDELVIHEAARRIPELFEIADAKYKERFAGLIQVPKIDFDTSGDGGGSAARSLPVFRR